eukprot:1192788-Prorocentrum_minimum.AAC.2
MVTWELELPCRWASFSVMAVCFSLSRALLATISRSSASASRASASSARVSARARASTASVAWSPITGHQSQSLIGPTRR